MVMVAQGTLEEQHYFGCGATPPFCTNVHVDNMLAVN
jgi:hypothetical protein